MEELIVQSLGDKDWRGTEDSGGEVDGRVVEGVEGEVGGVPGGDREEIRWWPQQWQWTWKGMTVARQVEQNGVGTEGWRERLHWWQ